MTGLSLGLDSSTQSLTAVVVDIKKRQVVYEKSLDYRGDARLSDFGLNSDYILPPREPGEANQPATLYFAALDAIFSDMQKEFPDGGLSIKDIVVINTSGQQHGHALFHKSAQKHFKQLTQLDFSPDDNLATLLGVSLALPYARIWKTAHTAALANQVRETAGGKLAIIELSGSDAPWRFSAFGIMKTALEHPEEYANTLVIHQISSITPSVLTGSLDIPLDYGNACGTSLMNYREKTWSPELIRAVGQGLPGGPAALQEKLPPLESCKTLVGTICNYFVQKYGFSPDCAIGVGSGDNPQPKVLVTGSLLSLGSSFVIMIETEGKSFDQRGYTNAMYDAFDRPFMFGCRTNGALSWDCVRAMHGIEKQDYAPGESALKNTLCGNTGRVFLWHVNKESFPVSDAFGPIRIGYDQEDFAADYVGVIESTLASIYLNSRYFMSPGESIYVAGGSTSSPEIMRRVAGIFNRNVIPIETGGAALGAAVSGAYSLLLSQGKEIDPGPFGSSFLPGKDALPPRAADVAAYHREGGFLETFEKVESEWVAARPG
jgi:xylulokinase